MVYLIVLIIVVLCIVILGLVFNIKRNRNDFQNRVMLLEEIIIEMNANLEKQNQKIELSEELKLKLKLSNHTLNSAVFNLNYEMLEELYPKK